MKSISHSYRVAPVIALGLLVSLAGCANAPLRHTTRESDSTPAALGTLVGNYEPATPLHTIAPEYPFELRRVGRTGRLNITGVVDELGRAWGLKAENASDHRFIKPSLRAVKQWTFKPARLDGVPVMTRVSIPIEFMLAPE